jgi:ribosomal protein L19E
MRTFFTEMLERGTITQKTYRDLRKRAKSGSFRSKRHVKLHLEEKGLFVKKK